ncbi:glutamate--cysteine ligase [Candidatus Sumerlaeota bacterium]|nr:glutamate--cysteine ligase [Candidatus Sumerlaeota bacterium]
MSNRPRLRLFEGFGIELEYMIVDRETLDVRPIAADLLRAAGGEGSEDIEHGDIAWSNELAAHVIELKTNGPAADLDNLAQGFQREVGIINDLLVPMNARLMPTAAHPWMDPHRETMLFPGEYNVVYTTYDRIFNCKGHGWSNLQSVHINLPFHNDEEFGRLHAAIRLVLPILPALAASSPILELKRQESLDARLEFYKTNSQKVPSITGHVIPEPVFTEEDYDREIFQQTFRDIAPHDPEGILREEFLNSRGAIARFSRGAIEIRVLDIQESPVADIAICRAIVSVLQALTDQCFVSYEAQKKFSTLELKDIFDDTVRNAGHAVLTARHADYIHALSGERMENTSVRELWVGILRKTAPRLLRESAALRTILDARGGSLSERILRRLGSHSHWPRHEVSTVYRNLCDALRDGSVYDEVKD